jgi:NitT/TauT family transport system substrate-binding protein
MGDRHPGNRETDMIDFTKLIAASVVTLALGAGAAAAQDKVTFATNWLAQAEHGGYYQAVADGTYAKYGLDVTIAQGGPQSPGRPMLVSGQVQFYMGGATGAINSVKEGIPTITLAAIFQKDPQILMSHPGKFATFADLAGASKYILSADGFTGYFSWMKAAWPAFVDEKYEPYQFNPASFLADENAIQQGYLTSEPYGVEQVAGFAPDVWLLADQGTYTPYSTTIETMKPWYEENKDVAKRFVEASIIGWYNYLYGDNAAGNALIKADNPEMTDEQIAYSIEKMKEYGILISGEAETKGIGCMTDERWKSYYDNMVEVGLYDAGIDVTQAYTTELVCQGLGVDLVK